MRESHGKRFLFPALTVLAVMSWSPASAEEIRGEELRSYIVGSTFDCTSSGDVKFWVAWDEKRYWGAAPTYKFEGDWAIDDGGQYRRTTSGKVAKRDFLREGSKMTMIGAGGKQDHCFKR